MNFFHSEIYWNNLTNKFHWAQFTGTRWKPYPFTTRLYIIIILSKFPSPTEYTCYLESLNMNESVILAVTQIVWIFGISQYCSSYFIVPYCVGEFSSLNNRNEKIARYQKYILIKKRKKSNKSLASSSK